MRLGWSAGASVEWMFNPKWSVKAEYLYYDLGTANTVSIRRGFQLPTKLTPISAPSSMSVRRDSPLHITVLPGGGSLARAR